MDRFKKLLAAATLLVLLVIAACGEDVMPPPPTGSIVGQVSIEGTGVDGVTVSLSNGASTATAGGGNYRFDNVEQGSHTVTISGFPADASFDATSAPANIGETGGTTTVDFRGTYIRTASIMGTVTVENMGLGGVTVRISGMADSETATDDSGQYSFTGLRAGTYSVEISGFDSNEVSFSSTSGAATVGVGESKVVSFDGTYLRTAGIMGRVSAGGEGLPNVTVTLMGQGEDRPPVTTDAGGLYSFSKLKSGTYQVAISGYDTDDYEFPQPTKSVTIVTGETANVPFEGTLLRTAGIAGRVSLDDGMGLDGVTVTLAGAAEATTETANGGQYSFAGLAAGTYVLSITNPDANAYNFADGELQKTRELADDQSLIVNFSGTHTRTASISGMLFIDEVDRNMKHNEGEPSVVEALAPLLPTLSEEDRMKVTGLLAKAKVILRGPDLGDPPTMLDIDPLTGRYTTGASLMTGSYQVGLPVNDKMVMAGLETAGVAFAGESMVVTVDAGGSATVNFPFWITRQTISVEAVMGRMSEEEIPADRDRVEKVELTVYANADGTNMLGKVEETDAMGMALISFDRDDNTGPGGNDNIVFVRAESPSDDLVITDNGFIEVAYAGTERVSSAAAAVRLVNVAVNFDFWVKSTDDVPKDRGGDTGLGGWAVEYCMPMADDPETDEKDAVVCTGDDASFKAIMTGEGDDAEAVKSDDGKKEKMNLGKVSFSHTLTKEMLAEGPVMFHVRAAEDQDGAMGEMWDPTDLDPYPHTGLDLPPGKDDDPTDLGPIRIKFTTQSLTVGVYRETDDQPGFTDYRSDYPGGDHRPHVSGIEIELMYSENGGRLKRYEYKAFDAKDKRTVEVSNPAAVPQWNATKETGGTVTFKNLPANVDFTVRLRPGADRTEVTDRDVDAYGDALDDMSMGSFGSAGGAMPAVKLCPLTTTSRPDFLGEESDDCATFAYQWMTGVQKVTVTNLRKDVEATVALEPDTDNHSEGDSKKLKGDAKKNPKSHTFKDIQDGVYKVTLTGTGIGKQTPIERTFYHNESSDDDEYDGQVGADVAFEATSLRAEIRGVVANNRTGSSNTLTGDEAFGGVELTLHGLKAAKEDTDNAFKSGDKYYVPGDAEEDDGDAMTATTNADGEYVFENLVEEKQYFVRVSDCDGCVAYHMIDSETHDFLDHGLGTAMVYADDATNTPPKWNHKAAALSGVITGATGGGFVDFAGLYMDGEVSGAVKEAFDNVGRHRVTLERCLTYKAAVEDDATTTGVDESKPAACATHDETYEESTRTDDDGDWDFESLREGIYEVTVNPRGSYDIRDGSDETQLVELTDGSGAAEEADDVHIIDGGKGTEPRLRGLVLAVASSPGSNLLSGTGRNVDADGDASTGDATGSDVIGDDDDASSAFSASVTYPSGSAFAFATDLVLKATAFDEDASIEVAVTDGAPDDDDFNTVESGKNASVKRLDGTNTVTVKVTAANGVDNVTYTFTFDRTAAQTGFIVSSIVVGCADDTNTACAAGTDATSIVYGAGYTASNDGSVDQQSNSGGTLTVTLPHNAHRVSVGGTIGEFSVTVTRATTSSLAAVSFQVGDASSTDGDADDTAVAENFVIPAQEGTTAITITVMSEAKKYGVKGSSSQEKVWTLNVKRAKAP